MPVYKARLNRDPGGAWVASSVELPNCWSRGSTRDEALAKLRDEIRYRIEYCPCSGVDEEFVRVELQVASESRSGTTPLTEQPPASAPERPTPPPMATRREWPAARSTVPAALSGIAGCPAPARESNPPARLAPGASVPEPAPGPRPTGWRRWDD